MTQGSRQAKQGTRRTGDRGAPAAGLIRAASIPVRVQNALGEALGTGGEQVRLALQTQAALAPALLRSREGATLGGETQPELDFAEAVRLSTNMSEDEKARWLAE